MQQLQAIIYPSSDGEPVAETSVHLWAMLTTLTVLRTYLKTLAEAQGLPPEREGIVLANQFLYYEQGRADLRVAPDVMVIPQVAAGERDNYKIWEEGQIPAVIFEITSESTRKNDQAGKEDGKFTLYQRLGVQEYWLFDPKGEWIPEQLRGYQLMAGNYTSITNSHSQVLGLRLTVEGTVIGYYREDTGAKLLAPDELVAALLQETQARLEAQREIEIQRQRAEDADARVAQEIQARLAAEQQAIQEAQAAERMRKRLRALGLDPDQV